MSSFSSKAAFLALLSVSQLASGQETCGPSRNSADFVYELIPTVGPTVRWTMDTEAGTISFEVESAEETWTSIGFSPDGMMVGADAVVGLPDDAAVVEYDLQDRNFDAVVLFEEQEITDASVSQGGGVTTMRFTRPLTPTVESKQVISSTPGDLTTIIWATGVDNTFGFHGGEEEDRFGFQVDLFCGEEGAAGTLVTTAPTSAPSMMDTLMPLAEGETAAPSSPAPTAADGDRGVGGGDGGVATPAPADAGAGATVTAGPTPAPSATEDGSGQGDASGASFVAGGSWVAVAAAGAVTALAALSL